MTVLAVTHLGAAGLGALGALITLLLTFALPAALNLAKGGQPPNATPWVKAGIAGVAVIYLALGAIAPLLFGSDNQSIKDALVYGMGAQGLFAGLIRTGEAAAK